MLFGKSKRKTLLLFLHSRICLLQNRNRFLDNPPFYSVTVWLCLPRYHKCDLKFHFFFSYIWPIIVSITLRSYCVIYKEGLLPTLLTLSWIKLEFGKILPTLTRTSFMYLYVHHLCSSIRLPSTQVYTCSCRILWWCYKPHKNCNCELFLHTHWCLKSYSTMGKSLVCGVNSSHLSKQWG